MKSRWTKWLAEPGHIRLVAIDALELMTELSLQQGLEGAPKIGYAEAVIGSLLVASAHKSNESINLNAQGSGIYKQALIDASPEGRVRGFLIVEKDSSKHTYGLEGHNGPWGTGILSILYTKNFEGKTPYTGMVPIDTGLLDDAINSYYSDSEQLISRVGLHVKLDERGAFLAARGALVQALGGATAEELGAISSLSVSAMRELAEGGVDGFENRASSKLGGRAFREVESKNLESFCNCSQERIERAMLLTGEDDAMYAIADNAFLSITCDFCRKEYRVSRERLKDLFSKDGKRLQ